MELKLANTRLQSSLSQTAQYLLDMFLCSNSLLLYIGRSSADMPQIIREEAI
jgi:hypothetical protein